MALPAPLIPLAWRLGIALGAVALSLGATLIGLGRKSERELAEDERKNKGETH